MIRKLSKNDTFFPFAEPRLNLFGHLERVSEEDVNIFNFLKYYFDDINDINCNLLLRLRMYKNVF
jgi:hypothetical protein